MSAFPEPPRRGERLYFAGFSLDCEAMRLYRGTSSVHLAPQPLQLLLLLLGSAGRLVTREEIRDHLWPERVVEFDQGLAHCIRKLREALGDEARNPTFIETVPRLGFRFLPEVRSEPSRTLPAREANADGQGDSRSWIRPGLALPFATALVGCAVWLALAGESPQTSLDPPTSPVAEREIARFAVEVAPYRDPGLHQRIRLMADRIPHLLQQEVEGPLHGTLRIELSEGPETQQPSLGAILQVVGYPRVVIDLDLPEDLGLDIVASDLALEFARHLVAPAGPPSHVREQSVTIVHPGGATNGEGPEAATPDSGS